ncbi:MAG: SDR family NAD(P)-dependent oxidoreductase [Actinomycetota bacterium]
MGFDSNGLRVLITGGSSGMGAAMAERFAAGGAIVGICARRADQLSAVLERCRAHSPDSRSWVCDLADPAAVDALARRCLEEMGEVDILVNNAGVPKRKHVTQLDAATVDEVTRINYLAPVQLTLALLPHMVERGSGRMVNVSSVAATLSSPGEAAYDASKAALAVFSEAMAVDLWETGVKVLTVYPGVVDTPLFDIPDNDPLPGDIERIPVDELVDGVMDALDSGASEVYVPAWFKDIAAGKAANIDGFLAGTAEWVRAHREA